MSDVIAALQFAAFAVVVIALGCALLLCLVGLAIQASEDRGVPVPVSIGAVLSALFVFAFVFALVQL